MDEIIAVKNLTKRFNNLIAVDNISFSVKKGEIFAFLGPNGAGKTTTIKMLITLLKPSFGEAVIGGYKLASQSGEVRKITGYVPQMISIDGGLTSAENLLLMARLYDISFQESKERVKQILSFLKLEKFANSLAKTLSGGMVRKLEIGQAMIHHPKVLFLDEPTTGLDPVAKRNVWEHLLELRDAFGTTIFFSTHNMEEAEDFSDRVAIMNTGRISALGSIAELKEKTGKKSSTLEDAFVFFTGNFFQENGNFKEIQQTRQKIKRLR